MSNGWDDVLDFISDEWIGLHEYEDHLLDRLKQMVCPIAERDAERARAERAEAGWQEAERLLQAADDKVNELLDLLHVNEQAFDEDTNAAVEELDNFKRVAAGLACELRNLKLGTAHPSWQWIAAHDALVVGAPHV